MRSYAAARGLFSVLSALSWVMIVGGGFLAIAGFEYGGQMRTPNPLAMAITMGAPGVALGLFGFIMLATSQVGRASVDTAEYSQQMLQLSREHLDVSRQSLRHGEQLKTGFEGLKAAMTVSPQADYAARPTADQNTSGAMPSPPISYGQKGMPPLPQNTSESDAGATKQIEESGPDLTFKMSQNKVP
jgi:hypothetical protein